MKLKSVLSFAVIGLCLSALSYCLNDNQIIQLAGAASPMAAQDQSSEKNMARVVRNLLNGDTGNLRIVLIQEASPEKCEGAGVCAEFRGIRPNGNPEVQVRHRTPRDQDWMPEKLETGIVFLGCTPHGGQYNPATHTLKLVRGDVSKILSGFRMADLTAGKKQAAPNFNQSVPSVILPQVYDWLTDTEGQCCQDCWDTHRSWGLPCAADYACCLGFCGVQPGCGGGGPDGPAGPSGGPQGPGEEGDGNECGDEYYTPDGTLDTGTHYCDFAGYAQPTPDGQGGCVDIMTSGFVSNCVPKAGGGGGGAKQPEEVEEFF